MRALPTIYIVHGRERRETGGGGRKTRGQDRERTMGERREGGRENGGKERGGWERGLKDSTGNI